MVGKLYGALAMHGGFNVVIKENPWNRWKVAGVFDVRSREEGDAAFRKKSFIMGNTAGLVSIMGRNVYKEVTTARGE